MSPPRSRWRIVPKSSRRHSFSPRRARRSATPFSHPPTRPAMIAENLRTLFDLSGRTAIITGATRGVGFALAQGHLAAGAHVVVTGRSKERCRAAKDALDDGASGRVEAIAAHM